MLNFFVLRGCYCVVVMVGISLRATRISKRKDFLGVVSFLFMDRRVCRSTAPQSDVGGRVCMSLLIIAESSEAGHA